MRTGTQGFVGARLRQARQARGLFGTDLARMVGVKSQTISAYEKDKGTPSPVIMETLAQRLGFSVGFFTRPAQPEETAPIFWRANNSATRVAQARAEARLEWLRDITVYLSQSLDFPAPRIPKPALPSDFRAITSEAIEAAALACREEWGLGDGPLSSIVGTMEENGVITAQMEVCAENLDAFSQWAADGTPYVMLALDRASGARRAFDASHELAHLVLHRAVDRNRVSNTTDWRLLEDQAHRFASAFLMPERSFKREVWAAGLDTFAALKPRWRVSVQAMVLRCRDLGMISVDQVGFLYRELSRRGWRKKEPHDDTMAVEGPSLVPNGVRMLVDARVRRPDQILAELALPAADLEELTDAPRGYYTAPPAQVVVLPTPKAQAIPEHGEAGVVVSLDRARRRE
jgi:Zn-dependent peptidase ImmA (M78 family)/transcriptional regulator with XRE-family HTH domain